MLSISKPQNRASGAQLDFFHEVKQRPDLFADLKPHIVKAFWDYHWANPHVYNLFRRFALDLRRTGREHYGVGAIFERIRWHYAVETRGDDFKLNNNYRSCYARLLALEEPSFGRFFQMRSAKGRH